MWGSLTEFLTLCGVKESPFQLICCHDARNVSFSSIMLRHMRHYYGHRRRLINPGRGKITDITVRITTIIETFADGV